MSNFTDTYIRNLKGKEKRYEQYEGAGFGIRVTPNEIKSWIYRYKIDGNTDKLTLGHYPHLTLANAKKRFIELSELRRAGQNPKKLIKEQDEQKNDTVEKLIFSWYKNYVIKSRKKPLQIKQQIEADIIPLLGDLSLEKIKNVKVLELKIKALINESTLCQTYDEKNGEDIREYFLCNNNFEKLYDEIINEINEH